MQVHIKIIGLLLIALALIHFAFPRYFQWSKELQYLSLINRQMMSIHTFCIALFVFLTGVLCLTSSDELMHTPLGKKIFLGLGVFWIIRLIIQFVGYSSKLWKGKTFETTVHVLFIFLWTYFSFVFCFIALT